MRDLVEWSEFSIVTSNLASTDSESDFSSASSDTHAASAEQDGSDEKAELTPATEAERIELPQPDAENITVLTDKLPNKPILPWNRYDSPWEESAAEHSTDSDSGEKQEEEENHARPLTDAGETPEDLEAIESESESESDEVD